MGEEAKEWSVGFSEAGLGSDELQKPISPENDECHEEWRCVGCNSGALERVNFCHLEGQEEGQVLRSRKGAKQPTPDEVRAHRITHLPFRDWCPVCVAGRAKD